MEEKTTTRSGGSRSDELGDFGFENVEWLALHSGVPIEALETLTAFLVEQVEDQTGRPPEGVPDPRALRTGLRRRITDKPVEEEAREPSSTEPPADIPAEPPARPPAEPQPEPQPRQPVDTPLPQPPLGDPPPPPTSPPHFLGADGSTGGEGRQQPQSADPEGTGSGRESAPPTEVNDGSSPPAADSVRSSSEADRGGSPPEADSGPSPSEGDGSGSPTEENGGGAPDGGGAPASGGGDPAPPAEPANPEQAALEEAWDKSGVLITNTAKEFAIEKGVWPNEVEARWGRESNGVKKVTQRDVRDANGRKSREKRKKEKEEARERALQQKRGDAGGAEPSGPSEEATEPEAGPRSDEETGEVEPESPEAEAPEGTAFDPSTLSGGDDDDFRRSAEELRVDLRPPYADMFEGEQDS